MAPLMMAPAMCRTPVKRACRATSCAAANVRTRGAASAGPRSSPLFRFRPAKLATSRSARRSTTSKAAAHYTSASVAAAASASARSETAPAARSTVAGSLRFGRALVEFTRPHTMMGTLLSISAVSLLAVGAAHEFSLSFVWGILQAVVPGLLMNIFCVGVNQLSDVDVDKINKPYLPLASGELSMAQGQAIVLGTGVAALALGRMASSPPLMWALLMSMALGIVYSANLPGMRWKRSPILAAGCILVIRAFVVQFCFYLHSTVYVLHKEPALPVSLIFVTAMMCLFSVVIAFFKDIPDVRGDRMSSIHTLSVRFGERTVLNLCIGLLLAAYTGAMVFGALTASTWGYVLVGAHAALAVYMVQSLRSCDTSDPNATFAAYMRLWQLFYIEYLLIPLFGR